MTRPGRPRATPGGPVLRSVVSATLLVCLHLAPSDPVSAQQTPDPCTSTTSPSDATLELTTRDGQTQFHEGEIVGLSLAFTTTAPGKYQADTRGYDRSGRLDIEGFCIDPATARDPLADYYAGVNGFIGGGLGGYEALSSAPYRVAVELNEWWTLPVGHFQVRVVSHRLQRAAAKGEPGNGPVGVPLISNSIGIEVVPATSEWQAAQLSTAIAALDSSAEVTAKHGARILRFLGSVASTRELARRYWTLNDQPNGWDLMFGLFGSPERQAAIDAMKAAIVDPAHAVSLDLIHTLSLLELQASANYRLPRFDPANREEWTRVYERKNAAYNASVGQHVAELAAVVDKKTASARGASVDALLTAPPGVPIDRAQMRRMLIDAWDTLPLRTRNELILSRWNEIGGAELLPLLRRIVNGPPGLPRRSDQVDRGAALRRIYELAPDEGRDLILREIRDVKGDIEIGVLGILPEREIPALDASLVASLQLSRGTSDVNYQLLSRYASVNPLSDVQRIYEPRRGRWACAPQTSMLRYFLRVAPDYGVAEIKVALAQRQATHCYSMLLPDLRDAVADPRIEALAIAALDDSSSEVVRYAAEALGRYGSAAAEEPLWRRLTAFHEVWKDRADELRPGPGFSSPLAADGMIEYAIEEALSRGQGWLCGPDKLARLRTLVTPMRQGDVDRWLQEWQRMPFSLSMAWRGDGTLFYSAGPYTGGSISALIQKLQQFASGTHFVWNLPAGAETLHRAEVDAVKAAADAAGLIVEIKSS